MVRYVIAKDSDENGDLFWVVPNPARPSEARWIPADELGGRASRTHVQTVWIDYRNNQLVEGAIVQSDSEGRPVTMRSDVKAEELDSLPTLAEFLEEWERNEVLRMNALDAWATTEAPGLARAVPRTEPARHAGTG